MCLRLKRQLFVISTCASAVISASAQITGASSAFKTQIQQAEQSDNPNIITDRRVYYIDKYTDPNLAQNVECTLLGDLLS
jgi:hypothetical protein